jgi:hypothetical protein
VANDHERIFELHGSIGPLLAPDALRELDRDLARWFMGQIQKRLRNGVMSTDLAVLAGRVADAFGATPEGASLRAALPTLRRSAGLCARCGQPYTGIADACPSCIATTSFPSYAPPPTSPHVDAEPVQPSSPSTVEGIEFEPE